MNPVRIAMWSGPRNISTAMMRAWGNRSDTAVIDEPFYAFYLKATGKKHPGASEIITTGETDWRNVVVHLTGPTPSGKRKPALADELKEIHNFQEDLREALGLTTLYNESLGTVSNLYVYDRVEGRDSGKHDKPWETQ